MFQREPLNPEKIEQEIAEKILDAYGFEVSVIVRRPEDLTRLINNNPWLDDPKKEPAAQIPLAFSSRVFHPIERRALARHLRCGVAGRAPGDA